MSRKGLTEDLFLEDENLYREESIGNRIYTLLIKNVSKGQPLTAEEAQDLKSFRATLTTEQWQGWLHFARDEKQKIRKKSPPKSSTLSHNPEQLLRAIMQQTESASGTPNEEAERREVPQPTINHISVPEVNWSDEQVDNKEQQIGHNFYHAEPQVHKIHENKRLVTPSPDQLDTNIQRSFQPEAEAEHKLNKEKSLETPQPVVAFIHHSVPEHDRSAPQIVLKRSEQVAFAAVSVQNSRDSRDSNNAGVSLELGGIRRSSRGRASSAPRDRPSSALTQVHHHTASTKAPFPGSNGYYSGPPLPAYKEMHTHSPKLKEMSRREDFFGGHLHASSSGPSGPTANNAWSPPKYPIPAAHGPYSSRVRYQQLESPAAVSLDLVDAAEIARSTAFRLDSAYSAAQCLMNTFAADQKQSYLATGGSDLFSPNTMATSYANQEKTQAALSILSEMMSSMEKSKEALSQLSSLHQQQQRQQPSHSKHRHSGVGSGKKQFESSRHPSEQHDLWASPEHASSHRRINRHRQDHTHYETSSSASNSPKSEEKGERSSFDDSSPFRELRRGREGDRSGNQELHFEDLSVVDQQHRLGGTFPDDGGSAHFRSSRKEAKWFPDSSTASLGATLNAQYAQERPSAEFSPWNRQLAASAVKDIGQQLDPVNNLQAQLHGAADADRRTTSYAHSIGSSPAPRVELQSQQFSYSRTGYVWEGVRYNRAQGPVVRLCLAQGPLIKAHDDYPIRVDAESGAVDVVWREARHGDATATESLLARSTRSNPSPVAKLLVSDAKQTYFTDSSASGKRNTVLRRERFVFDDIFTGLTAQGRLAFFTRQRARKALETAHNLVFMCLGCGDTTPGGGAAVEPPISVLLGGGGGTGLISSVVDEIFRFTKPLTTSLQESKGLYPGSFPSASPSAFVASKLAFEQVKSRVSLSAIILTEQGEVYDLLGGSTDGAASLKRRKSDGRVILCNASRLQLQASADFDRVMGLLLGKRTALHGVLLSLQQQQAQQLKQGIIPAEPLQKVLASIDPWASFNVQQTCSPEGVASLSSSSMLITVSVSGGAVTSNHTSVDFNFVSPCGENWSCPGADINILAELVSSLPNSPPPSLLRASALGMLLMDPRNPASDFINVVTVHREEDLKGLAKPAAKESGSFVVQGALHSLRIIAQLTQ